MSILKVANEKYRAGLLTEALELYKIARASSPFLAEVINSNIELIKHRLDDYSRVAISTLDSLSDMSTHDQDIKHFSYISRNKTGPILDSAPSVKAIAIYLPQYHTIPENDEWWGQGFTEWTNVRRGVPQYTGHYQPHIPHADIGYYDLRDGQMLKYQARLAKESGIEGFCFYYYWFNGKRILETPTDKMLRSEEPDFPFCFCWANENWTRTWDGGDHEILIGQEHSESSDLQFIIDLLDSFRDSRYIKIDGKPLLIVYRPMLLPNVKDTADLWRKVCREQGIGEICLAFMQSFDSPHPADIGYDFAIQFPPLGTAAKDIANHQDLLEPGRFTGSVRDYRSMVADYTSSELGNNVWPGVSPSWDNTARRQERGHSWINSTPEFYCYWLSAAASKVSQTQPRNTRFVFINAWNEWAEGNHLEPDEKYGYAWLNATKRALMSNVATVLDIEPEIIVIGHDAARAGAQIVLLTMLREWKRNGIKNFKLLLIQDGVLRQDFEAICETFVLSDYPTENYKKTILDHIFGGGSKLVLSNTVVNGPILSRISQYDIKVITYVHELQKSIERWAPGKIMDSTVKHTDHFIAVSAPVQENLLKNHKIRNINISLIHPYIDIAVDKLSTAESSAMRTELRIGAEDIVIIGCGTTDWRKGPDLFVKTAIELLKKTKSLKFVWIGGSSNSELDVLGKMIMDAKAEDHIAFIGERSNARQYFQIGHLFFLSSREDPYPLVALEAAAAGIPIVCYAHTGGMPSFVGKECGIVIETQDVKHTARNIEKLIKNRKQLCALGANARDKVERLHSSIQGSQEVYNLASSLLNTSKTAQPQKISVIIPNYNCGPFLSERFLSIVNQSVPPSEIIILDDASTDSSLQEIEDLVKGTNITVSVIVNKENSGSPFLQWQKGLQLAQYDLVWIAEADDSASFDFLETLLPHFEDPDVVLAYVQTTAIDEMGSTIPEYFGKAVFQSDMHTKIPALAYTDSISEKKWQESYIESGAIEITSALGIQNTIPNASATIVRKECALKAVRSALSYRNCGDWAYYIEMAKQGDFAYQALALNYFRRHMNSTTHGNPVQVIKESLELSSNLIKEKMLPKNVIFNNLFRRFLEYNWELRALDSRPSMHDHPMLGKVLDKIKRQLNSVMRKSHTILVVIPDAETGGGQTAAVRVANTLAATNNVFLISARPLLDDGNLVKLISEDVIFLEGTLSSVAHLRFCADQPGKYESDCSENRINTICALSSWLGIESIFSNVWWADKVAYAIHLSTNIPWYIHMHGCYEFLMDNPDCDPDFVSLVGRMMESTNGIFYLDPKNLKIFENGMLHRPPLHMANNGVHTPEIRPSSLDLHNYRRSDELVFCMCARGIPEKGWFEAVQAILRVNELPPAERGGKLARLVTIGSSEYLDELLAPYEQHPALTVLGLQDDPLAIMHGCDVGILPSYFISETQPNVVIEYMASSLAVIATRHGGIPGMMKHDELNAGLLVDLHGDLTLVDRLSQKMALLMSDDRLLSAYQKQSQIIFQKRFSIHTVADKILCTITRSKKRIASA
ncbi:glycoside hydrolase family 99-like domain-containing protein [Pseudomonas sp. PS01301]|uniref:glycoside hydrolase family 99-like domain-containing protein n=1 Tax=Pseudomonas sp. PS01301 TaxID=2991437 RepID=UPI002499F2E8|nr:glycoside hydrolase family 99-like domain-containing protein [Pseudomonas sp. PS01301]